VDELQGKLELQAETQHKRLEEKEVADDERHALSEKDFEQKLADAERRAQAFA